MHEKPETSPDAVYEHIANVIESDVLGGVRHPLQHYLEAFPGYEANVKKAYARLEASRTDGAATIGRYVLEKELGRGGQATVYQARDPRLDQQVAIKILDPLRVRGTESLLRFRREAGILARLDHPGICTVLDADFDSDQPYLVMPLVRGEPLSRFTNRPRAEDTQDDRFSLSVDERLLLLETIARTLHAAHEENVVHRDVKPSNIIVRADGSTVVLDFGIASEGPKGGAGLTLTGDAFGTPAYMSPEQIEGQRVDRRTDVWALGVITYELMTGRRPFGHDEAPAKLTEAIRNREPVEPSRLDRDVSRDLSTVILTALTKEPRLRYQDAGHLADDLARIREGRPVSVRRIGLVGRAKRWARRSPAVASLAAAVFLSLTIGLSIVTWQNRRLDHQRGELAARNTALTQSVARETQARKESESVIELITGVLGSIMRDKGTDGADVTVRALLDRMALDLETDEKTEPSMRARLHQTIGQAYWSLAQHDEAEKQWSMALEIYREIAPEGNVYMALVLHHLADLPVTPSYDGKVSLELAQEYLRQAMEIYEQSEAGLAHIGTAHGTAAALELRSSGMQGEFIPAQFLKLLRGFHRKLSEDQIRERVRDDVYETIRLWEGGERDEASKVIGVWARPALKLRLIRDQVFYAIERVTDLATQRKLNAFAEALCYYAIDAARETRGPKHAFVGTMMNAFAFRLGIHGKLEEAHAEHERALAFLESIAPPSNASRLDAMDDVALSALKVDKLDRARKLADERLRVTLAHVDPEAPMFADAWIVKARVALAEGGADKGRAALLASVLESETYFEKQGAVQNLWFMRANRVDVLVSYARLTEARELMDRIDAWIKGGGKPRSVSRRRLRAARQSLEAAEKNARKTEGQR